MEAYEFAKNEFNKAVLRKTAQGMAYQYGTGASRPEAEAALLNIPIDARYRVPLRDPDTNSRTYGADYAGADETPAS